AQPRSYRGVVRDSKNQRTAAELSRRCARFKNQRPAAELSRRCETLAVSRHGAPWSRVYASTPRKSSRGSALYLIKSVIHRADRWWAVAAVPPEHAAAGPPTTIPDFFAWKGPLGKSGPARAES